MPQKKDNPLLQQLIKGQSKEKMKRTTNLLAIPKINHNAERVTNLSGKKFEHKYTCNKSRIQLESSLP